jgi:hypothetical protein
LSLFDICVSLHHKAPDMSEKAIEQKKMQRDKLKAYFECTYDIFKNFE